MLLDLSFANFADESVTLFWVFFIKNITTCLGH